ncbi:MAG: SDR family oxidoreductase [Deltaproteobacteria bacterium]|nr:SDR family oxidoreductase [Deltaproteobacteria bacterium]
MAKIFITGASSGFGRLITQTLLKDKHQVVASMRNIETKNSKAASELKALGAHTVEMDVTNDDSVNKGMSKGIELLGGVDVVVNNAGIGVIGLQETFTADDCKKVFDVNVFGVQRVNRAALPHMREKRSGLLIHISSLLGRVVVPFYGPYNASKFALEALADNYRIELSSFGIESVLVEPGGYGTTFVDNLVRPSDANRIKTYGEMGHAPEAFLKNFEKNFEGPNAPNPQWVADAVLNLIKAPRGSRPFRTTVDRLGMGAAVEPYNKAADDLQKGMYAAFGMSDVLQLKM